ncbi:Aste57867_8012 [Aphanomyces stellatus]|uniref:Aste57867_8012 protein n=1 Tax=Aphanomyces stellatus TaxID=120398 RepID=A0A485KJ75_9STRA|nr:hypothetical protein As57867_007982 [Aphanomyces stellatus]VFT84905.1 Aste57867_8012 [Aphanomyces stellatus]
MKESKLKAKSNYVNPMLTEENKEDRFRFALNFLEPRSNGSHVFANMHEYVHVDEKWFFLTKVKKKFYVYDDEELALRSVKNKKFITKVMFLAAVARPRYDFRLKRIFDGKLGIWPFVQEVAAQRTSKNQKKGTVETKPRNVDARVYFDMMLNNVVPAVQAKFPARDFQRGVLLQQDNASPHKIVSLDALKDNGIERIGVSNQPPNSPDFNVLDLGYFNSIQSLQHQKSTKTREELIGAVQSAFDELPISNLAKTFLTLQKVMEKSLENHGGNNYKFPHMSKDATINDILSYNVECDPEVCATAFGHLN